MNANITIPSRAVAAALFLSATLCTNAFAGSKTERIAQTAKYAGTTIGKVAPIVRAGKAAVRGWHCVGHELGRREGMIKYNVDIGRCRL